MSWTAKSANLLRSASHGGYARPEFSGVVGYRVGQFVVESNVPLPELAHANGGSPHCRFEVLPAGPGFTGKLHWFRGRTSPEDETWLRFGELYGDYLLRFQDQGDFLISRDGREVQCRPLPGTADSTIRHLFLDQVVPLILSQREPLVLHASAVLTREGVIAFVGKSGQGKSTLAAWLGQSGFHLISDDFLVLRKMARRRPTEDPNEQSRDEQSTREEWIAIPSYPGVRLWPETSDGIFSVPPDSSEIAHYTDKRRVSDPALIPFAQGPSPLRCLYFLDDEDEWFQPEPAVLPLRPREAFMKLVSCAFNLDIRDKALLERQFEAIGQITSALPCFRLNYSRDFETLPAVRRLIVGQEARSSL